MTMQPLSLPPGTDRQLWTLTLGALRSQLRGEDDAVSPVVLDEVRTSAAGGGPLIMAFSTTLATQLAQQFADPITPIEQHLAELAAQENDDQSGQDRP